MVGHLGMGQRLLSARTIVSLVLLVGCSSLLAAERVRVGIYQNRPKVFIDEQGRPQGVFVDVLEYVAQREDWTLEYVPGTWAECLARLGAGQLDLMVDVAETAERAEIYSFHDEPVLSSWGEIYARPGLTIRTMLDLHGKTAVTLRGGVYADRFPALAESFDIDCELVLTDDYASAFKMVDRGKADACIVNHFFGGAHKHKFNVRETPILFYPTRLFFVTQKDRNLFLLQAIDRHLEELKADESLGYYTWLRKWQGGPPLPIVPRWFKVLAASGGGLLVLFLFLSAVLRTQVKARTALLAARTTQLEEENSRRRQTQEQLRSAQIETLHRLVVASEYRDEDTGEHIKRLSDYCGLIGKRVGLPDEEVEILAHAATMHDVGKIGVPDDVLLKPGKLDDREWGMMREHTRIGARMLSGSSSQLLQAAELIALNHHERWDGGGYPNGLAGEDIPLYARACSIADAFDAMTNDRPYRAAMPKEQALDIMRAESGKQFDPRLLDVFLEDPPAVSARLGRWN